jgi:hypothetical protein
MFLFEIKGVNGERKAKNPMAQSQGVFRKRQRVLEFLILNVCLID